MNTQEKQLALDQIAQEINSFRDLDIARVANHAVPGEGNPDAAVMFIGEAPGFHEDQQGRPFVGQAGRLLEKSLQEIGLHRGDVYITNVVKFRPPNNRDPFPEEIAACANWLDRQISVINPKIICTLGRFSMAKFISGASISRIHGQPRFVELDIPDSKMKVIVFPMYHPAAALRAGSVMREFTSDFAKMNLLLQPAPPAVVDNISSGNDTGTQTSLF